MKNNYSYPQLIYFARYAIGVLFGREISLQILDSIFHAWQRNRPNEFQDGPPISVEEQLQNDLDAVGHAFYEVVDGKKRRIDPTTVISLVRR